MRILLGAPDESGRRDGAAEVARSAEGGMSLMVAIVLGCEPRISRWVLASRLCPAALCRGARVFRSSQGRPASFIAAVPRILEVACTPVIYTSMPMKQLRFRTRLIVILSLFAIVPAALLTLLWSGTVSSAFRW